MGPAASPARLG